MGKTNRAGQPPEARLLRRLRAPLIAIGVCGVALSIGGFFLLDKRPAPTQSTPAASTLPRLHAELEPQAQTPPPAETPQERAAALMQVWRQSILNRDADGVLGCDRAFLDDPATFTPALVASAKGDSDERVRAFSTRVLGKLAQPALAPVFLQLIEDKSAYVRGNAAWALGQLAPDQARGLGTTALERTRAQDRDANVRKNAAEALARLRTGKPGTSPQ